MFCMHVEMHGKNAFLRLKEISKHVFVSMVVQSFKLYLKEHAWKALKSSFIMVLFENSFHTDHASKKHKTYKKYKYKHFEDFYFAGFSRFFFNVCDSLN